ncbi:MAG: signal peptidase I [Oscillospiraceae bacterium]|nr:signal peptidase I [Oscillospiraceae bacterium]
MTKQNKDVKTPEEELPASEQRLISLYDWLHSIISSVVIVILLFVLCLRQISVDGTSMVPTLHHTDRVLVSNVLYTPKNGDVVIIKTNFWGDIPIVKRVIAVGGQTIDINFDTHEVFVDGVLLDEPYINEPTAVQESFTGPVTVPEGCVFVMGDNRNHSSDSRDNRLGVVDVRNILGKVLLIIVPSKDDATGGRDWRRVGKP